jgi:DNA-directed RNA polymerase subunit RPC12/RpoP
VPEEMVIGGFFRYLLLPPDIWGRHVRCPDCNHRMFDAGVKLNGHVTIVCKGCQHKWRIIFFDSHAEYMRTVRKANSMFIEA